GPAGHEECHFTHLLPSCACSCGLVVFGRILCGHESCIELGRHGAPPFVRCGWVSGKRTGSGQRKNRFRSEIRSGGSASRCGYSRCTASKVGPAKDVTASRNVGAI